MYKYKIDINIEELDTLLKEYEKKVIFNYNEEDEKVYIYLEELKDILENIA